MKEHFSVTGRRRLNDQEITCLEKLLEELEGLKHRNRGVDLIDKRLLVDCVRILGLKAVSQVVMEEALEAADSSTEEPVSVAPQPEGAATTSKRPVDWLRQFIRDHCHCAAEIADAFLDEVGLWRLRPAILGECDLALDSLIAIHATHIGATWNPQLHWRTANSHVETQPDGNRTPIPLEAVLWTGEKITWITVANQKLDLPATIQLNVDAFYGRQYPTWPLYAYITRSGLDWRKYNQRELVALWRHSERGEFGEYVPFIMIRNGFLAEASKELLEPMHSFSEADKLGQLCALYGKMHELLGAGHPDEDVQNDLRDYRGKRIALIQSAIYGKIKALMGIAH